jgi:hypothetical protein
MGRLMSAAKIVSSVVSTMMEPDLDPQPDWTDEGPDDLWPDDRNEPVPDDSGELVTTRQYGLRMPNGDVVWGSWAECDFAQPLDRLRLIAKLQRVAQDCHWQTDEFVNRYAWVTREQRAIVRYEDLGTFDISDPSIVAVTAAEQPGDE